MSELPLFILPSNVDWDALDVELLNRIHLFPHYKSEADNAIRDAIDNLCGDEQTDEQQLQAGLYGHMSLLLAKEIRQQYKLGGAVESASGWDHAEILRGLQIGKPENMRIGVLLIRV